MRQAQFEKRSRYSITANSLLGGDVLEPDGLVSCPVFAALVNARNLPRVSPVPLAAVSERAHLKRRQTHERRREREKTDRNKLHVLRDATAAPRNRESCGGTEWSFNECVEKDSDTLMLAPQC